MIPMLCATMSCRLTFRVQPGKVTGFLGPNGAGKTTTLRLILGLNTPTSGTATVNGRLFRGLGTGLRHAGALLDAGDIHPGRSGYAHLWALARSNGLPRRRVEEVLAETGLTGAAQRRAGTYSLGMRQRLGIAAALLGDPPVLLFDEPLNGLDPEGVRWIRTLLRRLAAEGRTVLISSHLMSEMSHAADHLIVLGRGELIADKPLKDFAARSATGDLEDAVCILFVFTPFAFKSASTRWTVDAANAMPFSFFARLTVAGQGHLVGGTESVPAAWTALAAWLAVSAIIVVAGMGWRDV
jgi:ABC-type multidrug transport system ATPase subunit